MCSSASGKAAETSFVPLISDTSVLVDASVLVARTVSLLHAASIQSASYRQRTPSSPTSKCPGAGRPSAIDSARSLHAVHVHASPASDEGSKDADPNDGIPFGMRFSGMRRSSTSIG